MGTRTMGSHGKSDGLTKQGRLYNLTLDEVQHQLGDLGKPLSSMNIDELIKSVWTAESEGNQGVISQNTQLASASSMGGLSKKTVDELWQDMKKGISGSNDDNDGNDRDVDRKTSPEKQPTLGEMTLEDFLARAGIVAESSHEKKDPTLGSELVALPQQNVNPQVAHWMQYQTPTIQQQHVYMPSHHPGQQMINDVAYPETQMAVSSDTQTPGRKRGASGDWIEKSVERRQKRMIKNRESAARSRARKQICSAKVMRESIWLNRLTPMNWRTKCHVWKKKTKDLKENRRQRRHCHMYHSLNQSINSEELVQLFSNALHVHYYVETLHFYMFFFLVIHPLGTLSLMFLFFLVLVCLIFIYFYVLGYVDFSRVSCMYIL